MDAKGGAGAATMLMRASAHGRPALVEYLLSRHADPNARDAQGSSALHAASYVGDAAVLRALLRAGASVDARDADGETAADWARDDATRRLLEAQSFRPRIVPALLARGEIGALLALRGALRATPVHDDGAGHEVVFLHAARAVGELSAPCAALLDRLADAMRAHGLSLIHI